MFLLEGRAKLDQRLYVNVHLAVRHNDDRPAQVVGRAQRALHQPLQRRGRGTDLQAKVDKRKVRSVCHACNHYGHWVVDPHCPGSPVNIIELEDEVQEFEPKQDTGMRQVLSVKVDVSEVRSLRSSTRLVLAMNSIDVGRREEPAVSLTQQPATQ